MAAEGADPFGDPLAGQREEQQRQGGADRERERQRDGVERRWTPSRRRRRSRRAPVPRTAHTARPVPGPGRNRFCPRSFAVGDAGERLFQKLPRTRGKIRPRPIAVSAIEPGPPDRVLRKVQQRQQRGADQGDQAEAEHQAGDHPVGPQPCPTTRAWSRPRPRCRHPPRRSSERALCVPEKKITGSTGRMHGEMPVIRPPMKPISTSVNMSVIRSHNAFGSGAMQTQKPPDTRGVGGCCV